jgi:hypothetical protein
VGIKQDASLILGLKAPMKSALTASEWTCRDNYNRIRNAWVGGSNPFRGTSFFMRIAALSGPTPSPLRFRFVGSSSCREHRFQSGLSWLRSLM